MISKCCFISVANIPAIMFFLT